MNLIHMLGIISIVFCSSLFLMCYFRKRLNHSILNPLFIAACAVCFFCWNYAAYERGWLEDGFMTLENISPFICTVILLTPFMSKKIRDLTYSAIAFLACGMFLALFVSPAAAYISNHQYEATFVYVSEASCHLIMALYGFYLVLVGKVKINYKSLGKAALFIYSAVLFGVFLNYFYHVENFGMNMHGEYSIYWLDIFRSFDATFIAYIIGISGVLLLGFAALIFLDKISRGKESQEEPDLTEATEIQGFEGLKETNN